MMSAIGEIYRWACFHPDEAALLAGMGTCALWSAGYVLVTELRRHYRSRDDGQHINRDDKNSYGRDNV